MKEPLYGVWECEVRLHRHLIMLWVQWLEQDGQGGVEEWMNALSKQQYSAKGDEGYRGLGRVLLLNWALENELTL